MSQEKLPLLNETFLGFQHLEQKWNQASSTKLFTVLSKQFFENSFKDNRMDSKLFNFTATHTSKFAYGATTTIKWMEDWVAYWVGMVNVSVQLQKTREFGLSNKKKTFQTDSLNTYTPIRLTPRIFNNIHRQPHKLSPQTFFTRNPQKGKLDVDWHKNFRVKHIKTIKFNTKKIKQKYKVLVAVGAGASPWIGKICSTVAPKYFVSSWYEKVSSRVRVASISIWNTGICQLWHFCFIIYSNWQNIEWEYSFSMDFFSQI